MLLDRLLCNVLASKCVECLACGILNREKLAFRLCACANDNRLNGEITLGVPSPDRLDAVVHFAVDGAGLEACTNAFEGTAHGTTEKTASHSCVEEFFLNLWPHLEKLFGVCLTNLNGLLA
jgi:hypothetical protein